MQAAFCGENEMLETLIELGSDINAVCNDGDTAVHYAAAQGN